MVGLDSCIGHKGLLFIANLLCRVRLRSESDRFKRGGGYDVGKLGSEAFFVMLLLVEIEYDDNEPEDAPNNLDPLDLLFEDWASPAL